MVVRLGLMFGFTILVRNWHHAGW